MLKKVLTWGGALFVVYYLATQPQAAAQFVGGVLSWLQHAGDSLSTFVNHIAL